MRLIDAFKAFWQVLTGTDLAPRSLLDELQKALEATETTPDRFAEGAVYTLVLMQREGRLVDFLQENIEGFSDEQIGAAVRSIHAGAAKVLAESFRIRPVLEGDEGSPIEIGDEFDPKTVRLTGNVPDAPPYKGKLTHKGWRANDAHFPSRSDARNPQVIQAAEVEI